MSWARSARAMSVLRQLGELAQGLVLGRLGRGVGHARALLGHDLQHVLGHHPVVGHGLPAAGAHCEDGADEVGRGSPDGGVADVEGSSGVGGGEGSLRLTKGAITVAP